MLSESKKVSVRGDYDRRWMSDDYFDLIVWYRPNEVVRGFQLCYGKPRAERALTWIDRRGFSHTEVDGGEDKPPRNRTPVLVPNGFFPKSEVSREFSRRSGKLPKKLRKFVRNKISQFPRSDRRRWLSFTIAGVAALAIRTLIACFLMEAGFWRGR